MHILNTMQATQKSEIEVHSDDGRNQVTTPDSETFNGVESPMKNRKKKKKRKNPKHTIPALIKMHPAQTFCQNSSIRGVPKLIKHPHLGLRFLWVVFILTMMFLLIIGSSKLIIEYLEYNTLINTREGHSSIADFPSVTICNHHPFKHNASKKWKEGDVLSPREFSENLRVSMKHLIKTKRLDEAKDLFFNDKLTAYYETIGPKNAKLVGHDKSSVIYCILQLKNSIRVGHNDECGIHYTVFQHPKFFNCHTLKVLSNFTKETIALGLIVKVGEEPDYSNWEMGLVQDVFNQAHGTRIVLHEPNTYPDPIRHGTNLEAGKFAEMKFDTNKWTKKSSPKESCLHPTLLELNHNRFYNISSTRYNYTSDLCEMVEFAKTVYTTCSCYSATNPLTTESIKPHVPYCNRIDNLDINATMHRVHCIREEYLKRDKQKSEDSVDSSAQCEKRCEYHTYDVHTSASKWVSSNWQLYWLMKLSDTWTSLDENTINSKEYNKSMVDLYEFLDSKNLTDMGDAGYPKLDSNLNVFFVVTRSSFVTMEKVETLSLTSSALLSRIGGLSSLTLGVTFATFFEIVEFMCLCFHRFKSGHHKESIVIIGQSRPASDIV